LRCHRAGLIGRIAGCGCGARRGGCCLGWYRRHCRRHGRQRLLDCHL
jgi:hypothetical protein